MNELMQPIHPAYAALLSGKRPEPCEPFVEVSSKALARLLDVVEFGDQLERVEKDNLLSSMKELLAQEQPELWAIHSVGPGELHPMISKEAADSQAAELAEMFKEHVGKLGLRFDVIRSPFTPLEHFEILAEELTDHCDNLLGHCNALEKKLAEKPAIVLPMPVMPEQPEDAVDDSWMDGYNAALRMREQCLRAIEAAGMQAGQAAPAVVNQQVTTADLTSVRCQCCQAEHAADSYDAGFIAGSGMCQVCDSAMPPKDLPAAVSAGVEEVEVVGYRFFHVDHGYIFRRTHIYEGNPSLEAHSLMTVAQHRRILDALINTPHTDEWFDAVRLEAAHQIQRWGTDHDAGKQPADWFWLLGYLSQKAMTAQIAGDEQKAKHHTISSGAMLLNWFRAMVGDTNAMRPGIAPAQQEQQP
ncbi:hypothetical protein NDO41_16590 [Ectopseudomonas mendocina]|nr:hypothetical protein NDO41_16590 [Pseudomonas mendocina]